MTLNSQNIFWIRPLFRSVVGREPSSVLLTHQQMDTDENKNLIKSQNATPDKTDCIITRRDKSNGNTSQ